MAKKSRAASEKVRRRRTIKESAKTGTISREEARKAVKKAAKKSK